MARPIPVFSFVFAAYAATSGGVVRVNNAGASSPLGPQASFRTVWRAQAARGGALFAKIGVLKGDGPLETRLAVRASGEVGEEFWVGRIIESGLGFIGAPVATRFRPEMISAGQHLRFHVINVLDWRVGACPETLRPHENAASPMTLLSE